MVTLAGVGSSTRDDARCAGAEAAGIAIERLGGKSPSFAMVFGDVRYHQQSLLDGVTSVVGNTLMIGGSGASQIGNDGPIRGGVVVMTLCSNREIDVLTALGQGISQDARAAGQSVAQQVADRLPERTLSTTWIRAGNTFVPIHPYTFIMLPDFTGDGAEVVAGVGSVLPPPVQVVGGTTADDLSFNHAFQYHNGRVYSDAVAGALLIAQVPTALGVAHRWRPVGEGMVVTRAEGDRIIELDNTPAIQAYVRVLGALAVEIPDEALGRMALTNPLGVPEVTGEYQLRHPISAQDDGSILCAASIAEGSVVRMMTATVNEGVAAVRKATRAALAGLGRAEPALAIVFNWGVRLMLRPMEEMRRDVSAIREEIGPDVPMAGFFTYGEQASTPGGPVSFYNESCVIYVVGR